MDQEVDGGDDRREEVEGVFPQGDGEDHCGVAGEEVGCAHGAGPEQDYCGVLAHSFVIFVVAVVVDYQDVGCQQPYCGRCGEGEAPSLP